VARKTRDRAKPPLHVRISPEVEAARFRHVRIGIETDVG
jgi:hypothetical protein